MFIKHETFTQKIEMYQFNMYIAFMIIIKHFIFNRLPYNLIFFSSRKNQKYCLNTFKLLKILDTNQIPSLQIPREEQSLGQTSFPIAFTTEAHSVPFLT